MNTEVRGGLESIRPAAVEAVAQTSRVGTESGGRPERPEREPARDTLELSEEGRARGREAEASRDAQASREADDRRVERQEREHRVRGELREALATERPPYRGRIRAAEAHRELAEIREADERERAERIRARHDARRAYREVAEMRPENSLLG